jgi:hypothetical protein
MDIKGGKKIYLTGDPSLVLFDFGDYVFASDANWLKLLAFLHSR